MNKGDLQRGAKSVSLADLSIYYTWKNIKKSYNSNKFKILGTIQDEEFNLPDGFLFCARHSGLFWKLLTPKTMKLLGSTEEKITKGKNGVRTCCN